MTFEKRLRDFLNQEYAENESNTPDFILAQYLLACLTAFNQAVQQRENWYGRDPRPSAPTTEANDIDTLIDEGKQLIKP